jgi:mannonate dehydratase
MDGPLDTPMPRGMAWNMVVDPSAPLGTVPSATHEQLWQRLGEFLDAALPVAEEAGVILAAHPDDPPMPTMRGQPRLVYQPQLYQRLLDLHLSPASALEFCIGTLAGDRSDVFEATPYSRQGKLAMSTPQHQGNLLRDVRRRWRHRHAPVLAFKPRQA